MQTPHPMVRILLVSFIAGAVVNCAFGQKPIVKFGKEVNAANLTSADKKKDAPIQWVQVNTPPEIWTLKNGELVCAGRPIGVMRSEKQYENFIMHVEWKHMEPGGNSGVFVWSSARPDVETVPDNPRGTRSKSIENRCKGRGEWNTYDVVCVDGVIKLAVNGKFVNGVQKATQKKGYLCLESEGAEIHFRNLSIMELPAGVTTPEQVAEEWK